MLNPADQFINDLVKPKPAQSQQTLINDSPILALTVCPNHYLASGSTNGVIKLWNLENGLCQKTLLSPVFGYNGEINAITMCSGNLLASGSTDKSIKLWDLGIGECQKILKSSGAIRALAMCSSDHLASGFKDASGWLECGEVELWDLHKSICLQTFKFGRGVNALIMCPDGRLAISGSGTIIKLWDQRSSLSQQSLVYEDHSGSLTPTIDALAMCHDGYLASGDHDGIMKLWDLRNITCWKTLVGSNYVIALTGCPNNRLASGSYDNNLKLWDLERGFCQQKFEGHSSHIKSLTVCPDGRLASGSADKTIRIWELPRASSYHNRGRPMTREELLRFFSSGEKINKSGERVQAEFLYNSGRSRLTTTAAIEDYNKAIRIDPKYTDAFYERGKAKFDLGHYEAAIKDFNEVIKLDYMFIDALTDRGTAKIFLCLYKAAIEDFDRVMNLNPQDADVYSHRGRAKFGLGLYQEAISDYKQANALGSKIPNVWSNHGYALLCLNKINESEVCFNKALEIEKDFPFAIQGKGIIALCQHSQLQAEQYFRQVSQSYQHGKRVFKKFEICNLYFIKAKTCLVLGFIEEARSAIKQVLAIDSNYVPALKLQPQLQILSISKKQEISEKDILEKPEELKLNPTNKQDELKTTGKAEKDPLKGYQDKQQQEDKSFREVRYSELEIDETKPLGSGGFATVYKGKWNYTTYAIKKLKKDCLQAKEVDNFLNEIKLMSKLNHPHIVRFYAACTEVGKYCIVMEYCEKHSLCEWLEIPENKEAKNWWRRIGIAADIGKGLMYLHDPRINMLHRDLKSKNVLLVLLGNNIVAKITDFGLSKTLETVTGNPSTREIKGTLAWIDPEVFQGKAYSKEHDIYSYGMVLWEIYTCREPYQGKDYPQIMGCKWKNENETFPEDTPIWYKELVNKCWSKEVAARPSAEDVVKTLIENTDYPKEIISNSPPDSKKQSQLSARFSANPFQSSSPLTPAKPAAATNAIRLNEILTSIGRSRNSLYSERPSATNLEAKAKDTFGRVPEDGERKNAPSP